MYDIGKIAGSLLCKNFFANGNSSLVTRNLGTCRMLKHMRSGELVGGVGPQIGEVMSIRFASVTTIYRTEAPAQQQCRKSASESASPNGVPKKVPQKMLRALRLCISLVAMYRAMRLQFGFRFDRIVRSNSPRNVKNQSSAKQRPVSFPTYCS